MPIVPVDKRDFSICELIETEKNYIDALSMIKNNFIVPLSKYLSEDEKKCIFFGIEVRENRQRNIVLTLGKRLMLIFFFIG